MWAESTSPLLLHHRCSVGEQGVLVYGRIACQARLQNTKDSAEMTEDVLFTAISKRQLNKMHSERLAPRLGVPSSLHKTNNGRLLRSARNDTFSLFHF